MDTMANRVLGIYCRRMRTGSLAASLLPLLDAGFCFAGRNQATPMTRRRTAKSSNSQLLMLEQATTKICQLHHDRHRDRWHLVLVAHTLAKRRGNVGSATQEHKAVIVKSFVARVVLQYEGKEIFSTDVFSL